MRQVREGEVLHRGPRLYESADCTALQECLAPCAQDDIVCILGCQEMHPKGNDALTEVGSCARSKCKSECPSNTPDANVFGDGGI